MNSIFGSNDSLSDSRPADERTLVHSMIRGLRLHQALAGMALGYDLADDDELREQLIRVGHRWAPTAESVVEAGLA